MRNSCLIAACLAFVLPMITISADAAGKEQRGPRGELVHKIVMKWGPYIQEAYRADVHAWASDMVPVFAHASMDNLRRAADARSFEAMNDAFLSSNERNSIAQNALVTGTGKVQTRKLGDEDNDLVFVPVTPCRIIDTRVAGGPIAANTVRNFDVTVISSYSSQGGEANNCNGVGAAGSFAAAAINFTVVTPSAAGYITAFPYLTTQPLAATVNYTAGDIRGNYAVVKLDQGPSSSELSVYSFAQTHLVADIVGYYITPEATQLDCVEVVSTGLDITAGSFGTRTTPNCPTGYEVTGGGCSSSSFDGRVVTSRSFDNSVSSQYHFCAFRNEGSGTANFVAYGRCCRTPGR